MMVVSFCTCLQHAEQALTLTAVNRDDRYRHMEAQTDKQDRQTNRHAVKGRQTDEETDRQTDKEAQTDRQTAESVCCFRLIVHCCLYSKR